jgi:hypothetical protein
MRASRKSALIDILLAQGYRNFESIGIGMGNRHCRSFVLGDALQCPALAWSHWLSTTIPWWPMSFVLALPEFATFRINCICINFVG